MTKELVPAKVRRGPGRPPTHGAYSKFRLAPLTDEKIAEIRAVMEGEKLAIAPTDALYIKMLGRVLAQLELIDRDFEESGIYQDEGRKQVKPTLSHYLNLAKQAARMLEQLGMTPAARYKLGREMAQTEDIASKLQQARGQ